MYSKLLILQLSEKEGLYTGGKCRSASFHLNLDQIFRSSRKKHNRIEFAAKRDLRNVLLTFNRFRKKKKSDESKHAS